jgi:hypothetical protein
MFKNKIFIVIVVVAVVLAGIGGWYAYDRHQAALAAEKAEQEALAKAEAEKKAAEEEAARKAAEEADKEENDMYVDEQGRGPVERMLAKDAGEVKDADEADLSAEQIARMDAKDKKYGPEFDAIMQLLTDYNRAQNDIDYRTMTGLEGTEYMIPGTEFYKWSTSQETVAEWKKVYQDKKLVTKFDGVNIRVMVFTTPDFNDIVYEPDDPSYAYAEVEVNSHDIEPVKSEVRTIPAAVWLKKVDGQWKIYGEKRLDKVKK